MAIVDLQKVRERAAERLVQVSFSAEIVGKEKFTEPFYDYDEEGEPQDYGFDISPRDPTPEEFMGSDFYYNVSPSEFTETAIKIASKGKANNFSFSERPYLKRIYNTDSKKVLLKSGRQTEKSTSLGNKTIAYCCLNNHFKSLFVAPAAEQTKVFSNDRIKEPIDLSPLVQAYTNSSLTDAVFHKKFINHSQIRLRYAYLTADRVRGIPADSINIRSSVVSSLRIRPVST